MSRRAVTLIGLVGAGGAGYYFYKAGGDPKVAEKKFEHDAARLSSDVKSRLPGSEKEAKTGAKLSAQEAGSKIDSAFSQTKAEAKNLGSQLSSYEKDAEQRLSQAGKDAQAKLGSAKEQTGSTLMKGVDKFDKTVEEGASKAKSGISSWFGGSK